MPGVATCQYENGKCVDGISSLRNKEDHRKQQKPCGDLLKGNFHNSLRGGMICNLNTIYNIPDENNRNKKAVPDAVAITNVLRADDEQYLTTNIKI